MSFALINLTPPAMVVAGAVALVFGHTTLGLWLIGLPLGLGVFA